MSPMHPPAPEVDEIQHLGFEVDPELTLAELRHGSRDPTIRFERGVVWRAAWMPAGPATLRLAPAAEGWRVTAWGPGAAAAAAGVARLLGSEDDPRALDPPPGRLRELTRRLAGLRFGRTDTVWPLLLAAICSQKVTSAQAHRSYFGLLTRFGSPAPGPGLLRLPPAPETIAGLPYYELHAVGLEQRRAVSLIRAAGRAPWLEAAVTLGPHETRARLEALPGIGPWTAAEVVRNALGDADAVSLGDAHVPDMVGWVLAGEARADDARMLELLEPFRGQRARVVRILQLSGIHAPRYGPRLGTRRIERL